MHNEKEVSVQKLILKDNTLSGSSVSEIEIGTLSGSKIGQSASKIGFYGAPPIARPTLSGSSTVVIEIALKNLGLSKFA